VNTQGPGLSDMRHVLIDAILLMMLFIPGGRTGEAPGTSGAMQRWMSELHTLSWSGRPEICMLHTTAPGTAGGTCTCALDISCICRIVLPPCHA
jgi:hypothetical protein